MKTTKIVLSLVLLLIALTVLWCADASAAWTIRVVSPSSDALIALGGSTTFTVEVQQNGSPASGQTVAFSTKPSAGSGPTTVTLSSASGTTGSNGRASTTVTFPHVGGTYRLIATSQGASARVHVHVGFTPPPPPPPVRWTISVGSSSMTVAPGGSVTLTATVQRNGSPASGESVVFSADPSTGVTFNSASGTTGNNGQASTTVTFANAGSYTLKAASQGVSDTQTVTVRTSPPPPVRWTISVGSSSTTVAPGGSVTLTATVQRNGSPASGESVVFSADPSTGVTFNSASGTTGNNGQASTTVTFANAGSYTLKAASQGVSDTQTVTVRTSPPPPVRWTRGIVLYDRRSRWLGDIDCYGSTERQPRVRGIGGV